MRTVTKQELVSRSVEVGCEPPSDDLLRRLAREGLLPRPKQRHPGRRRGSVTEYPSTAVDQAIGVLQLHSSIHRFDNLRFWAFWDGLWVESRMLRQTLSRWLRSSIPSIPRAEDPFDLAERLAFSQSGEELKRHLGVVGDDQDSQSAVFALLYSSMGGDPGWDYQPLQETTHRTEDHKTPAELVGGLFQLSDLTEPIGSFGPILDRPPHPKEPLSVISDTDLGNPGWWNKAIRTVPLAELGAARDTARILVEDLPFIADTLEQAELGMFPAIVTSKLRAPQGWGAAAIRHRVQMIGSALALNRIDQQQTVKHTLEAIAGASQEMQTLMTTKPIS